MPVEAWAAVGAVAALAAAVAAYLPLLISNRRRSQEIAAWRASVDSGFERLEGARLAGDKELGRRLDKIDGQLTTHDQRQYDLNSAVRDLAQVAGTALGRTERD